MALAKDLGINDYPCAAGGCLLTDQEFAKRVRDLIKHDELDMQNINLLKVGRYFRLSRKCEADRQQGQQKENNMLTSLAEGCGDYVFGPATITVRLQSGKGQFSPDEIGCLLCRIVARYCDRDGEFDSRYLL